LIPDFDQNGYLPPGVHGATMEEIAERFGRQSELRHVQMESLQWLIEAARRARILRIIIDGSFTTDRLEPNDIDCALMTGPGISPDVGAEVESLWEIPFLHVMILDPETFDRSVDDLFGTDRWDIRKGIIEVTSWN
jgi:hypothetical protein